MFLSIIAAVWAVLAAIFRFEALPTQWAHSSPIWNVSHPVQTVPEPAALAVLAIGAVGLLARRRR